MSARDDAAAQPHQIEDALWRVEAAGVPSGEAQGGLLVCGGGAIAAELIAPRATAPVLSLPRVPGWVNEGAVVLCVDYAGDGAEALAAFEEAGGRGARRVVLTTGGELAERARANGVPVIGVPSGMPARAAVVYEIVATLECAAACGAAPSTRGELEGAVALLAGLVDDPEPAEVAGALAGRVPLAVGVPGTEAVAARFADGVRADAPGGGAATVAFVFPDSMRPKGADAILAARGANPVEHALSLVMMGDLAKP